MSENGKLQPLGLGKIKINATITINDETFVAQKVVNVRLYNNFYGFVRKIAGHFSLFAILGLCLAGTFCLLVKPKWLFPICTLGTGAIIAGFSEMFQLPIFSDGRVATGVDVLVDFLGACLGFGVALIVVGVWHLIDHFCCKGQCFKTMHSMSFASLKPLSKQLNTISTDDTTVNDNPEITEEHQHQDSIQIPLTQEIEVVADVDDTEEKTISNQDEA